MNKAEYVAKLSRRYKESHGLWLQSLSELERINIRGLWRKRLSDLPKNEKGEIDTGSDAYEKHLDAIDVEILALSIVDKEGGTRIFESDPKDYEVIRSGDAPTFQALASVAFDHCFPGRTDVSKSVGAQEKKSEDPADSK